MLCIEDSIKDRLASYFHWKDRQGLEQAIAICQDHQFDLSEIKKWAIKEGFENQFQDFTNQHT
jgi:hypothetical protein